MKFSIKKAPISEEEKEIEQNFLQKTLDNMLMLKLL